MFYPHHTIHPHLQFAFFYIFNLIVGVGALALPKAFSEAGLVLGALLLVVLAFVSYMTTTYMTEAMAAANAYEKMKERKKHSSDDSYPSDIQKINQVHPYSRVSNQCLATDIIGRAGSTSLPPTRS